MKSCHAMRRDASSDTRNCTYHAAEISISRATHHRDYFMPCSESGQRHRDPPALQTQTKMEGVCRGVIRVAIPRRDSCGSGPHGRRGAACNGLRRDRRRGRSGARRPGGLSRAPGRCRTRWRAGAGPGPERDARERCAEGVDLRHPSVVVCWQA